MERGNKHSMEATDKRNIENEIFFIIILDECIYLKILDSTPIMYLSKNTPGTRLVSHLTYVTSRIKDASSFVSSQANFFILSWSSSINHLRSGLHCHF